MAELRDVLDHIKRALNADNEEEALKDLEAASEHIRRGAVENRERIRKHSHQFFHFEVLPRKYHGDDLESGNSQNIVLVSIISLVKDDCISISGYQDDFKHCPSQVHRCYPLFCHLLLDSSRRDNIEYFFQ
jgi:hypothetical protein